MSRAGGKSEVICVTLVRQWRRKRVLKRPEAAFPYVFAAEGAQHPPKRRHETAAPGTTPHYNKKVRPKSISRTINPNYYDAKL